MKKNCTNENNAAMGEPATAGDRGAATSRGASSVGENGAALARGKHAKVKGGRGAILVVAEECENTFDIKSWCAGVVDGETLKPDVWYRCENGKFIEETEEQKDA